MDVNFAVAMRASCLLGRCRNPHYFIRRITASSGSNCIYATPHPTYGPTLSIGMIQSVPYFAERGP